MSLKIDNHAIQDFKAAGALDRPGAVEIKTTLRSSSQQQEDTEESKTVYSMIPRINYEEVVQGYCIDIQVVLIIIKTAKYLFLRQAQIIDTPLKAQVWIAKRGHRDHGQKKRNGINESQEKHRNHSTENKMNKKKNQQTTIQLCMGTTICTNREKSSRPHGLNLCKANAKNLQKKTKTRIMD